MEPLLLVMTNCPDRDVAREIGQLLVDRRLAACVNILNGCTSIYRWQGATETAEEVTVLIKTRTESYEEVERLIRQHHPYELPEVLAVRVDAGSSEYIDWVRSEATPAG
jgi:periplasmic divalent cation tolerance protein